MRFESQRLELVKFAPNFLEDYMIKWFENPDLMRFYSNSKKKIDKEELLKSVEEGENSGIVFTYFIKHKEANRLIGTIKIGPILEAHNISDLVTLIGERGEFGKGIGTEAISLGVQLAFQQYGIRKLYGGMYQSNIASIKAYTRAGWVVEGVLKGHYLVEGKSEDRILVGCFNPKYFSDEEIENAKYEKWYKKN